MGGGTTVSATMLSGIGASVLPRAARVAYAPPMEHHPEDSALMLRYRDGDVSAFETLYRRHNDSLYRYLLRLCRNPAAAEDVFQEVWSKIIKARENYRPTAKFTTFLYHVAHNCFVDHVRRNKRHENTADVEPDSQADASEQPDDLAEKAIARRRLEAALRDLPDEQRDVFLLHQEAGLSLEQIAAITDCKRETAKSRLRYAIRKLRVAIDESTENR
jgi:RNA polymerase sigma-70 factor (ECF subfamily)